MKIRGEECLSVGDHGDLAQRPFPPLSELGPRGLPRYNYFRWRLCRYTDLQPSELGNNLGGPLHGAAA